MTRAELTQYIFDTYSVEPDYPFSDDNVSAVFRHPANRKWFALAMNIPRAGSACRRTRGWISST